MSVCIKDLIQNMNLVIGCTVGCPYCYARNNVKRYHMIDDFSQPEFFPGKLRLMDKPRPQKQNHRRSHQPGEGDKTQKPQTAQNAQSAQENAGGESKRTGKPNHRRRKKNKPKTEQ